MKKCIVVFAIWALVGGTVSAEGVDVLKLVGETQQLRQDKSNMDMVWWIPNEYWEHSFKANPVITPEQEESFVEILDRYFVFSIMEGTIGMFGGITGTSKEELESKVSLIVGETTLAPVDDADLSNDARNFFQMMKPAFANMLGQMGQSMEFIVFEGKNIDGENHVSPKEEGAFTLKLDEKEFTWRLPLACFLPAKYDPKTMEEFPGNYSYNPFTGDALTTDKPSLEAPSPATE